MGDLLKAEGEGDEVLDAELFGAEVEDGVAEEVGELRVGPAFALGFGAGEGLKGITHHLAALAEGGLDDGLEKSFIAAEGGAAVAAQADDGGLDFRGRVEGTGADGEQVFDVIPGLQEDGEDAVGLGAGAFGDTLGDFFLDHADDLRDLLAEVQDLEEDLGGNVVGEVADDGEGVREVALEVHLEEVFLEQSALHPGEVGAEVFDGFAIDFNEFQVNVIALQQVLRKDAHAGADLQHRESLPGRE